MNSELWFKNGRVQFPGSLRTKTLNSLTDDTQNQQTFLCNFTFSEGMIFISLIENDRICSISIMTRATIYCDTGNSLTQ